ncbi:hypothetical protein V500_04254 [Pseudogymnoascus sp. VKM F-4518 (FW-2643)]|nr:hypothetical protein V500_04254 [Pseudogymnoascus sp. VKM F-4518 (FW-2643)]
MIDTDCLWSDDYVPKRCAAEDEIDLCAPTGYGSESDVSPCLNCPNKGTVLPQSTNKWKVKCTKLDRRLVQTMGRASPPPAIKRLRLAPKPCSAKKHPPKNLTGGRIEQLTGENGGCWHIIRGYGGRHDDAQFAVDKMGNAFVTVTSEDKDAQDLEKMEAAPHMEPIISMSEHILVSDSVTIHVVPFPHKAEAAVNRQNIGPNAGRPKGSKTGKRVAELFLLLEVAQNSPEMGARKVLPSAGYKSINLMTMQKLEGHHRVPAPFEKHGFRFAAGQRESLGKLWEHLQNADWSEEALEEELFEISASFWMQQLQGDPFASMLWHFVGVLGIDGGSGQFRPAHLFTYVLAGLMYAGKALLEEWAIPTRDRPGMEDLRERFAQVRDAWLCKATYYPMGYTLSLLLYGRAVAKQTGSRLMVSWSRTKKLMYFMGKPILMDYIRNMVADMTDDAGDLLWNVLMFKEGDDVRFKIPLADIEDDLTHTQRGKSFIHSNGLAGKEVEMLEDLVNGRRRQKFLDKMGNGNGAVSESI